MSQAQPVIAIDHLTKRYGDFEAVNDLTLHVAAGSICGLLGPNGAGKTTAMKCLLGFLHPTSGTLSVGGTPVAPETFEHLSYVPENSALFDDLTTANVVETRDERTVTSLSSRSTDGAPIMKRLWSRGMM